MIDPPENGSANDGDARPWEMRGVTRRDPHPHRGAWLVLVGSVSLVTGLLACGLPPLGLVAVLVGWVVTGLCEKDLQRIREGELDPAGLDEADLARHRAARGIVFGLIGVVNTLVILWAWLLTPR